MENNVVLLGLKAVFLLLAIVMSMIVLICRMRFSPGSIEHCFEERQKAVQGCRSTFYRLGFKIPNLPLTSYLCGFFFFLVVLFFLL